MFVGAWVRVYDVDVIMGMGMSTLDIMFSVIFLTIIVGDEIKIHIIISYMK